jgi:uncharacterized caspase-like protein
VAAIARAEDKPALNGVALVVGESKYQHIAPLPNPANDARDMLTLLSDLGFDARSVSDRDAKKLKRDLERFVEDAEGADVAFLYYSGHGIEAGGENWLVPVDADLSSLENADETLVALSAVMDELKAKVPVAIVLLDACRTNPFPEGALIKKAPDDAGTPIGAGGLTPVRGAAPLSGGTEPTTENLGTVIGFAAEPGRPALDGAAGENSPYAAALLRHLGAIDGEEFGAVMRMVTEEVYLDTKAQQRPWVNESLRRFLYFGVPIEQPEGDEGEITGERRKLLLTISEMPEASRAEVQNVAAKANVPLDSLFGVLKALGAETPSDPKDLEKVLDAQAERLKKMIDQRNALNSDDPEIKRLSASADEAIRQGALVAAKKFLDEAVARVEATSSAVDDAEQLIKEKRIADAAVYAKRADASALAFDYLSAASDYAKAYEFVEKWDERLRWNYKNQEAEALMAAGDASGDRALLEKSLDAYQTILNFIPRDQENRDWAITRNNMAVVYQTIGERESDPKNLEKAIEIFRESLAVFEREKDDVNWAAAQTNIGNGLLVLGQRESDPAKLEGAVTAFRTALEKRDRAKVPLDWASSQNNVGIALFTLAERTGSPQSMQEAEAAYGLALEEYRRDVAPLQWAMVQNNLGNTLNGLGAARNDRALHEQAAAAFRAAMEVRTRENFPLLYGSSQLNLGNALFNMGKLETDTASLEASVAAFQEALTVLTRESVPMDWASAQHNMSAVLQTIGQRTGDLAKLGESSKASEAALQEFTREKLPLDWAMAQNTLGNTLMLTGLLQNDPEPIKKAVAAFKASLEVYKKDDTPKLWALVQSSLGSALQSLSSHDAMLDNLKASVAARKAALEVLTFENAPLEWATAQNGIGTCLLNLSNFEQKPEYLPEARQAFEQAKRVFTRESQPAQWAMTINNIGDVHWSLGSRGGGEKEYNEAIAHFEQAKEGFTEAGQYALIFLLDKKITLIRDSLAKKQ